MPLKNKLLIFLAASIFLLMLIFLTLASYLNSNQLEKALSKVLTEKTGHTISFAKIKPGLFNQIIVEKPIVTLKGEKEPFVEAEEIRIRYSFKVLLTNLGHFSQSIEEIAFLRPRIWLKRDLAGQWNYEKLGEKKEKKKFQLPEEFITNLVIRDGEVFLEDNQRKIKNLHLKEVKGFLSLKDNPQINFAIKAREGQSYLTANGFTNLETQKIDAKLQVKDFSVASWRAFLPKKPYLTATAGSIDASLRVSGYYPQGLSYQGKALVNDGKIKSTSVPLPVEKIRGQVDLRPGKISFRRLEGFIGETPVQLAGDIYLGKKTLLDLDLQSPNIIIEEISKKWVPELKQIKRTGELRGHLSFLGPTNNLRVGGDFYLSKGEVYRQGVQDLQLELVYQDKVLTIDKAKTNWEGGKLEGQGIVKWPNKQLSYNLSLLADSIPISSLPVNNKNLADLKGKVRGSLLISGTGSDLKKSSIGGFLQLDKGTWRKIDFSQAKTHFFWDKGKLDLKYLIVEGSTLAGRVSGTIGSDNQVDLDVNLPILRLNKIAEALSTSLDLRGKGSFQGKVTGKSKNPELEGSFTAFDGRLLQQDFEELAGKVSLKQGLLNLEDFSLRDGITQHSLKGEIRLAAEPILNLTLESRETKLEKLLRLTSWRQPDLKGRVNSVISLQGTPKNLSAKGELNLSEGSWKGEQLDRAKIKFHWQDSLLSLDQVEAQQDETFMTGKGWVDKAGKGEIVLNVRDVDLEKIPYLKYKLPPGSKKINLLGKVAFNSQNELKFAPLIIVHGRNGYRLAGQVHLGKTYPTMDLVMTIEKGDLTIISALIPAEFPYRITGEIQGKVNLWGRIDHPNSRAIISLRKANIGQYPIEDGKMDLIWKDEELQILQFKLVKDNGFLAAQGKVDFQGQVQVDVVSQNLEGKLLSELFGLPEKLEGLVALTAQVRGKTKTPNIACSLEMNQGKIRATSFDQLYGLATWKDDLLNLQQVTLRKDKYKLTATGTVPTKLHSGQRINLQVKMEEGDLGLLTMLADKQIDWATGSAQAWLQVGGTLKSPIINGEISIAQGKIKPKALLEPLEGLEARLLFQKGGLEIEYLRGLLGQGSFEASGTGKNIFSSNSFLDFELKAKNLEPKSKIFQGILNGELTLEGNGKSPLLQGQITVSKGIANIPVVMNQGQGIKSGLRLDIEAKIRDNLRMKAAIADLYLKGGVHVGGTLSTPELKGIVSSKKGTINYLGTKFRLTKGLIEFKEKDGILPTLDLQGKTRYKRTSIFLQVTGKPGDIQAHFTSNPALSEKDIIILLTLRGEVNLGEEGEVLGKARVDDQLLRIAGDSIPLVFLEELENSLGNSLGLDEFYISHSIWQGPQINLGKYLWDDKLYVNYTLNTHLSQSDDLAKEDEKWYLEAQYRINPNLSLNYSRNNLGENEIMLIRSYSF